MTHRVTIRWTETAKKQLAELPPKVRRGLLDKANDLRNVANPLDVNKPLVGPLAGYNRICYARYRAIYTATEEPIANGDTLIHLTVIFIAVGQRKERDKNDIYRIAEKVVDLGIVKFPPDDDDSSEP